MGSGRVELRAGSIKQKRTELRVDTLSVLLAGKNVCEIGKSEQRWKTGLNADGIYDDIDRKSNDFHELEQSTESVNFCILRRIRVRSFSASGLYGRASILPWWPVMRISSSYRQPVRRSYSWRCRAIVRRICSLRNTRSWLPGRGFP